MPQVVRDVLRSPGQPIDAALRAYMEPRFGEDFGGVRVHSDARAAASADALDANAYTMGRHVVIGASRPPLEAGGMRNVWAHELAHVVQQRSTAPSDSVADDGGRQAESEARRAAVAVVQGKPVGAIQGRSTGALQLQPRGASRTPIAQLRVRAGDTDRIDDAYAAESLDQRRWRAELASAEQEYASGDRTAAIRSYLRLYADVARMAQADRVVPPSTVINVVAGGKTSCTNARPGLNFSPLDQNGWGANATTAFVDDTGRFGVLPAAPGTVQHLVAIVLSRAAFKPGKEETLAILRHELVHAEDDAEQAASALRASRTVKPTSAKAATAATAMAVREARTARADSELRGYVEGFMTMFHLTHPAPTSSTQPAFVELLGALDTDHGELFPWAEASAAARADVMGRIQEYYCHALDAEHRSAFDAWVSAQLAAQRPVLSPGGVDDARLAALERGVSVSGLVPQDGRASFVRGLRQISTDHCRGITPSLRL